MLFADKLGMPKKIKDLAESLDLEVTNHHDPEFDAKLCALIFGELTDKYPSYQELIRKIDDQPNPFIGILEYILMNDEGCSLEEV